MTTTIKRLEALNIFPESGHCVYPIGHPGAENFQFCDARVAVPGSPYCREHLRKCHIAASNARAAVLAEIGDGGSAGERQP